MELQEKLDMALSQVELLEQRLNESRAEAERVKRESVKAVTLTWSGTPSSGGGAGGISANSHREDIEALKQALHDACLENSGQAALIEQLKEKIDQLQYIADFEKAHLFKRQEPSRLEIAAMFMARNGSFYTAKLALEEADALIAAAKGGAQ